MTTTPTAINTINSQIKVAHEMWRTEGTPPPKTRGAMGKFLKMIKKGPGPTGMVKPRAKGKGTILVPLTLEDGINPATQFAKAVTNHREQGFDRFEAPINELWNFFIIEWGAVHLGANGGLEGIDVNQRMTWTTQAYWRGLSWMVHEDGTGALAKLDGSAQVGGAVITLLNRRCIHRLSKGDIISLSAGPLVPGTLATRKVGVTPGEGGFLEVIKINQGKGQFTVDGIISTVIPTAADTDYIVLDSAYDKTSLTSPGKSNPIAGLGVWVPIKTSDAEAVLYGVDKSEDVESFSGIRLGIDGTSFQQAIQQLSVRLGDLPEGQDTEANGTLFFNQERNAQLMAAFAAEKIIVAEAKSSLESINNLQFGVSGAVAQFPSGHKLRLLSDRMMCDKDVATDDDWLMRVVLDNTVELWTTQPGINWQLRSGDPLQPIDGTSQDLAAPYGAQLQMTPTSPAAHIVMQIAQRVAA